MKKFSKSFEDRMMFEDAKITIDLRTLTADELRMIKEITYRNNQMRECQMANERIMWLEY